MSNNEIKALKLRVDELANQLKEAEIALEQAGVEASGVKVGDIVITPRHAHLLALSRQAVASRGSCAGANRRERQPREAAGCQAGIPMDGKNLMRLFWRCADCGARHFDPNDLKRLWHRFRCAIGWHRWMDVGVCLWCAKEKR